MTPPFLQLSPSVVSSVPSKQRIQALYASSSPQRVSNPTGYEANVTWWSGVIEELLRVGWINGTIDEDDVGGDRLVLKVDEGLLSRLEGTDGLRPKGIGGVVERLANGQPPVVYPISTFLSSPTPIHHPGSLTYRLVGRPLWWAVAKLNPFGSTGEADDVKEEVLWAKYGKGREYVHLPLLERSAAALQQYLQDNPPLSYSQSVFSKSSFLAQFGTTALPPSPTGKRLPKGTHSLSERDVEVLLRWLSRDKGVVVVEDDVIRLLEPGQLASEHPINEADRGVVAINDTLTRVDEQIKGLVKEIDQCQMKAKASLAKGQKTLAMSSLRSKKRLEELLERRLGTAEQLRTVVEKIDQAKSDVEIMSAYETATSTLASVLSHPSLDLAHVEKTTDALSELMANQEEIDSAIRLGGQSATKTGEDVDEDSLAEEFEAMVQEEKAREAERLQLEHAAQEREKAQASEERRAKIAELQKKQADLEEQKRLLEADPASQPGSQDEWQRRYDAAQDRQSEEKKRAEVERMQKEERARGAREAREQVAAE